MQLAAAVRNLKAAGTAQTRKTYARHGIPEPMFGVSFAHLKKLAKQIGEDQALAEKLWATGNFDCRALAIMIAEPDTMKLATLNAWGRGVDNSGLSGMLGSFVAETKHAWKLASKWCAAKNDYLSAAGWSAIAVLAMSHDHDHHDHGPGEACGHDHGDDEALDELFATCVAAIEANIHTAPNRTRYAMNGALIAIGSRDVKFRQLALAAAKRIGPVEVDHGDTDCKTPDAESYIAKMWAHQKAQAAKGKKPRKRSAC